MKPKIFIAGDSWGCGEWARTGDRYGIIHLGLEQYFTDSGYIVINTAQGNSSNSTAVTRLDRALDEKYSVTDIVFFIQTDSIRELRENYHEKINDGLCEHKSLEKLRRSLCSSTYDRLSMVANKFRTKIQLIGGKEDLDLSEIGNFKNLNPLVPSWVYLLVGHIDKYKELFPQWTASDYSFNHIDLNKLGFDLYQKIIDEMFHSEKCYQMFKEDIFYPDGLHPNRRGHEILFEHIVKK